MADNKLEILLTAETEQATKAIQQFAKNVGVAIKDGISIYDAFEAKIKEVETALKKASDPATIVKLNAQLKELNSGFSNIKAGQFSSLLGGIGKPAGNATNALTNLNRVIQDAPFGIIGIANNIEPLIQSFQSLSKQSGGTGGALKALGGALAGPTGVLFGVSALTSAFVAFGPAISDAITGISAFDKAQQEAGAKGAEAFAKANDQFSNFLRLATDSGNSLARQNDAFENANKLLDDYGLKINSLADFQKNGAQIGALYAQIKQEEAKATVLASKAAEEYAKRVALGVKVQQEDFFGVLGEFSFVDQLNAFFQAGSLAPNAGLVEGIANSFQESASAEKIFNDETLKVRQNIDGLIKQLTGVGGVTEDFGKKTKVATSATKLQKEQTIDWLKWADQQIQRTREQAAAQLSAAAAAKEATRAAAAQAAIRATPTTAPENLMQTDTVQRDIANVQVLQQTAAAAALAAAEQLKLDTATQNTNAAFALLSPSINQAFDALANGENATEALGQAIKQLIVQLIKAVVQAAILAAIMNAIAPGSSAAKGGFLGIFKGLLGFRANGGPVQGGGPYVVGENGPELFVPSTQGNIVPNMALAGAGGGNVSFEIRGDVLYGLLRRTQNNRNGNF